MKGRVPQLIPGNFQSDKGQRKRVGRNSLEWVKMSITMAIGQANMNRGSFFRIRETIRITTEATKMLWLIP